MSSSSYDDGNDKYDQEQAEIRRQKRYDYEDSFRELRRKQEENELYRNTGGRMGTKSY